MVASVILNNPTIKRTTGWRLVRLTLVFSGCIAAIWISGFALFLSVAASETTQPARVDAIVVLTGGPDRVEVALRLLAAGTADRLLVSGAGERTDVGIFARRAGLDPVPLEQRVTLGRVARSTHGNALETAAWAREKEIGSILVVTAWFHMPRALLELHRAMPAVTSEPYPVGHFVAGDLAHGATARRVVSEYHKYIAALAGITILESAG